MKFYKPGNNFRTSPPIPVNNRFLQFIKIPGKENGWRKQDSSNRSNDWKNQKVHWRLYNVSFKNYKIKNMKSHKFKEISNYSNSKINKDKETEFLK